MTDTDDTDDLLLIPQDFFVIESEDSEYCDQSRYFSVVDSLIEKVDTLKKRIKSIESRENLLSTSLETSLDRTHNMLNPEYKFRSSENLFPVKSAQTTPQKPFNKFRLNSLPASPNNHRFHAGRISSNDKCCSNQNDHQNLPIRDAEISNEIDKFLSKVKTIQRFNTSRNLETDLNSSVELQGVLDTIERKHVSDPKQNSIKEVDGYDNQNNSTCGDYRDNIPDYMGDVRNLLHKNETNLSSVQARKKLDFAVDLDVYPTSDSSLDSPTHTLNQKLDRDSLNFDNLHVQAVDILSRHKQLLGENGEKITDKVRNKKEYKPKKTSYINENLGLLRLGEIWKTNSQILHLNQPQMMQKYQEENLRRKHCENLIHELQNRNLELQQKLSVAVKVDDSKNAAIQQFQDALERIMSRMEKLNTEKQAWESEISKLKDKHADELEAAKEQIQRHESESSKVLNLAHDNQEKIHTLEQKCMEFQQYITDIENKLKDLQADYDLEVNKNKQLSGELNKRDLKLMENKGLLQQARDEVVQSRRVVEIGQSELAEVKNINGKLENMLREEREEMSRMKDQKNILLNQIEDYKRKQSAMQEDLNKSKDQLETIKLELNNFYQGQLEILVQNKLKEFQNQLDKSEATFKDEIKRRELEIAKTAAYHIHQIKEKFSLEIDLLEKKHQEESNLHHMQQDQLKQQLMQLQTELKGFQAKRISVVKQLQKMMEAQWTEALRIIQNGKSPGFGDDTFSTIDQLNSLKVRSYNNLEEMLNENEEEQVIRRSEPFTGINMIPQIHRIEQDRIEKCPTLDETPLSRRNPSNKQYSEKEIQKYVNLLLNRLQSESQEFSKNDLEPTKMVHVPENANKSSKHKEKASFKRPWK